MPATGSAQRSTISNTSHLTLANRVSARPLPHFPGPPDPYDTPTASALSEMYCPLQQLGTFDS